MDDARREMETNYFGTLSMLRLHVATFTATFANGSVGTFSISRVAHGLPNGLSKGFD